MRQPTRAPDTNPPPRGTDPLATLAEIAASLATSESVDQVIPPVLETVRRTLDGSDCAVWLGGDAAVLQRRWVAGVPVTTLGDVARVLGNVEANPPVHAIPLLAQRRTLGVIALRTTRALAPAEILFFSIVGDVLSAVLAESEYAMRLETEVVLRTAQIEEQRQFMARVVDSLPVGLYVIDRDYQIQAWNRKRETGTLGVSREVAIGRPIFEIMHRQSPEMLRREFEEVFETGEQQQFQVETGTGPEARTYRLTKIPMQIDDRGGVSHVITLGEDITEWREAQERIAQAEKLAAVGTMTAGVMHEINNPLATIAAAAEAAELQVSDAAEQLGPSGAALRATLRMVQGEVQRCKKIVDTLLNFSRPKPASKEPFDVNAALDRTLFLLQHHPRFRKLEVAVEAAREEALIVLGDEEQMIQVFMALLLNAMDAMQEEGTVLIRTSGDEGLAVAEIIDRGVGIRRSDLPKLFEPFYTTKPPGRGTGLGLSICYAIVAAHGGRIEVESSPGEGSAFRILLPRQSPHE